MEKKEIILSRLGSQEAAWDVFKKMTAGSTAYSQVIEATKTISAKSELSWEELPILTKSNFYAAHPWRGIVPRESYRDIYSVIRSSGTTNAEGADGGANGSARSRGFFWPQLKSVDAKMAPLGHALLTKLFNLEKRKTLVVVGLSLGSWAGGEQFTFLFKSLALTASFPLVVFAPGNQHQEILEIIEKAHEEFDQILIAVCPSAIFYLERLAAQKNMKLPLDKITFLVTGEPFPEEMRVSLQQRSGRLEGVSILSIYGAADAGVLGFETPELVEVRQALGSQPGLAAELGFARSIPNLYHAVSDRAYFEKVGEELVITKWQGVPLVRYNLADRVQLLSWRGLCLALVTADPQNAAKWTAYAEMPMQDLIAVSGRSQGCLFLCGSNIFESMLQEAFLRSSMREVSTGMFVVWTGVDSGQQILNWQIELKADVPVPTPEALEVLHAEFVTLLSGQQPEFADDYEKFYRPVEHEGLRIFRFHFSVAPHLTEHVRFVSATKRKVILDAGPI